MRSILALPLLLAGCAAPALERTAAMVAVPAGPATQIGDNHAPRDERPQFALDIKAFRLDRTPVTVAQFRAFVAATDYVTEAETFGSAGVMTPAGWEEVDGATWRRPRGPAGPAADDSHPVTQVSWNDAVAFCRAYGLRLPSEFEWERAARLGQTPDGVVYDASTPAGLLARIRANTWQGVFPITDTGDDGFTGVSPVGAFGEAPSGLTDMAGNVWEWTSSPYIPYPVTLNDPRSAPERVQRGGSFLCSTGGCEGFRVSARAHSTPETALMHVGFRCADGG